MEMTTSAPHFVQSYERLVDELLKQHPLDEAMCARGRRRLRARRRDRGRYPGGARLDYRGAAHADLGCGSGRLVDRDWAVRLAGPRSEYLGSSTSCKPCATHAAAKRSAGLPSPPCLGHLSIPAPIRIPQTLVVACSAAGSLASCERRRRSRIATDAKRGAAHRGGAVVFSYLTLPQHWRMPDRRHQRQAARHAASSGDVHPAVDDRPLGARARLPGRAVRCSGIDRTLRRGARRRS